MSFKQKSLPSKPGYYDNPGGTVSQQRFGSGQFGSDFIRVHKYMTHKHEMSSAEETITITHGLGKVLDVYGRYSIGGDLRMIPDQIWIDATPTIGGVYISELNKRDIRVYLHFSSAQTVELELIFAEYDLTNKPKAE